MNIIETIAKEFNIKIEQVEKTVALIDEGNTIPFIARYRKEVTGSLDDVVRLYLLCAKEHYSPVSSRSALIDAARSAGFTLPQVSFDCEYDRQLYQRIGACIMEEKKRMARLK